MEERICETDEFQVSDEFLIILTLLSFFRF